MISPVEKTYDNKEIEVVDVNLFEKDDKIYLLPPDIK